jgi:hypothetical protein
MRLLSESRSLSLPLAVGTVLGIVAGAFQGVVFLTLYGFWGGLMWPLLVGGLLALWFAAGKQRAGREAIVFGLGAALGLTPWAIYEWRIHDLNGNEVWFPILLAFLAGSLLSPIFVVLRHKKWIGLSSDTR